MSGGGVGSAGEFRLFHLTAKTGPLKGSTWPIGQKPLVVGRESACDVSILDPLVSRRHCEISSTNGSVRVRDLGSSNATFVNGESVKEVSAKTGDEVAVGNTIFIITKMQGAEVSNVAPVRATQHSPVASAPVVEEEPLSESPLPATNAMTIGEPFYLNKDADSIFKQGKPRGARDLAFLYQLTRSLSQAESVPALLTLLVGQLVEHFQPRGLSVLLWEGETLTPFATPEVRAPGGGVVERMAGKAVEANKGMLLPERLRVEEDLDLRTTMLAPLVFGKEKIGVLALQSETPARLYDETDLEFLIAVAHATAPILKAVEKLQQLKRENERLVSGMQHATAILGESAGIVKVRQLARQCARSGLSVLVLGETGTGKELVARMIHDLSDRADRPLTVVNCAAIPDELFESEVFGYERGAFTGATARKIGLFEESDRGTLFLDEIGDLSLANQARILRVLESGTFRRLGGQNDLKVDVRVVSATNRDLAAASESNQFRRDLYHRLNAFEISIPPLRDRRQDVPLLAEHFLDLARTRYPSPAERFSPEALRALQERPWKGNCRELRNVVERAVLVARGPVIQPEDLGPQAAEGSAVPFPTLEELEKGHILRALEQSGNNMKLAAQLLGIGRSTMYRKLEDLNISL